MYKYLPTFVFSSIYDIDFNKLYAEGKRIIISDLDNTLLPYYQKDATHELVNWKHQLDLIGFKLFIITNNDDERIKRLLLTFNIDGYLTKAHKPSPKKLEAFLNEHGFNLDEVIFLGDQLVTDIACANNLGIDSILVKTIDTKHQKWYTKINRLREKKILKQIHKLNPDIGDKIYSFKENK